MTVPVHSQGSSRGGGGTTEHRVRVKKVFMDNPRQGRMVQLHKPPTRNAKHAHPKLEGEGESSEGTAGDKGWRNGTADSPTDISHLPDTGRCD